MQRRLVTFDRPVLIFLDFVIVKVCELVEGAKLKVLPITDLEQ